METILKPGDIFLTKGPGFISKAIRVFTRVIGEKRTKVNHVGIVVEEGSIKTAVIVEAVSPKVKRHPLWEKYGPPAQDEVAVYRAKNLTDEERAKIVASAERQVNKKYGFLKIAAHFLDWLFLGVYVFRRFARNGDYPICSWLVAHAFSSAGKHFGVDPDAAEPDDISDFVEAHPDIYECIRALKPLSDEVRGRG